MYYHPSMYVQSGVAHVSVDSQDLQFGFVSPQSVSDSKVSHLNTRTYCGSIITKNFSDYGPFVTCYGHGV